MMSVDVVELEVLQGLSLKMARPLRAEAYESKNSEIAITGIVCRFPGTKNIDLRQRLLLEGEDGKGKNELCF